MNIPLFLHSTVDRHLDLFHLGAITIDLLQTFLCTSFGRHVSVGYVPGSGIAKPWGVCVYVFTKWLCQFIVLASKKSLSILASICLFHFSHSSECLVAIHCDCNLYLHYDKEEFSKSGRSWKASVC